MRLTSELEPARTRTEKELARRFEQLRPEDGHVHANDVRITALYEALVRDGTTILGVLKEMDTDGNGSVSFPEFRSAVKRLHLEGDLKRLYSDGDLSSVFDHLDEDGRCARGVVQLKRRQMGYTSPALILLYLRRTSSHDSIVLSLEP